MKAVLDGAACIGSRVDDAALDFAACGGLFIGDAKEGDPGNNFPTLCFLKCATLLRGLK